MYADDSSKKRYSDLLIFISDYPTNFFGPCVISLSRLCSFKCFDIVWKIYIHNLWRPERMLVTYANNLLKTKGLL